MGFSMSVDACSLRRAMNLMFGAGACNEKKFTFWARQYQASGTSDGSFGSEILEIYGWQWAYCVTFEFRVLASKSFYNRLQAQFVSASWATAGCYQTYDRYISSG